MLRGVRWQLLALLMAGLVFTAAVAVRVTQTIGTPTPAPASATVAPTEIAALPSATPLPVDAAAATLPPAPSDSGHYREALIGTLQRLNPLFASLNPVDRDVTSLIFEGLTRLNIYGEPVPALAEGWVISSDGLEYIVSLRQDVLWHDGTPFTARDVEYTMRLLRDPRFPGAPELGAFWRTIETDRLDDHRVRFRLAQPLGAFLDRLTIGILPEHVLRGTSAAALATHPFNLTPIGTGPYQLMGITAADGVTPRTVELAAAPNYRARAQADGQAFQVQQVTFRLYDDFEAARSALASGAVDGLAARDRDERRPLFDLALTEGITLYNTVEPTVGMIVYNWTRESTSFFREQRVRLALETGLDRASAIERALSNLALRAESPLIMGNWAYSAAVALPTYDPAVARQMLITASERIARLANAAATPDPALPTPEPTAALFTFAILTPNSPSLTGLANEIATQWAGLGLDVRVEAVDIDLYESRLRAGDFDAALVEFGLSGSGDPDVYSFWHEGQYPDGSNYGGVNDRRISEILERARRESYNINRIGDYRRFQEEFIDRAIALPVYYPLFTYAVSPAVSGVQLGYLSTPANRFDSIGDWVVTR